MRTRGKKYQAAFAKVDRNKLYPLEEACKLVKEVKFTKMDESIDLAINLGVDPRHADQNIRGAVPLPHGAGKSVRIVIFAKGEKAVEASKLNVVEVGGDDLAAKINGGWLEFDQVIATPDMMAVVGKLGKVLGPRGLMPNPKVGTVTFDLAKAVTELTQGRAEFRVDKAGIVHTLVGKSSFPEANLVGNVQAVMDAILRAKPSTAKGTYIKKVSLSSTMGPGIKVDTTAFKL
jgi:large subunit ribosomal protein L1